MSKQKSIITEKWPSVKLGDLVTVVNENEYEPLENGYSKYVSGRYIESDKLYVTKYGDIETNKEVLGSAFHRVFKKGQLLFGTRRAYLRKAGLATFDGICANTTLVLESKEKLLSSLFPFIFHWEQLQNHAINNSVGSTNPYVRWRDLAKFEFQLPPIPIQELISKTLKSIQQSIETSENLLTNLKIIEYNYLPEILTQHPKTSKTNTVNWLYAKKFHIPENWDAVHLKSLVLPITKGTTPTTEGLNYVDTGVSFFKTENLSSSGQINNDTCDKISISTHEELSRSKLEKNDILFSIAGTLGSLGLVTENHVPANINQALCIIRLENNSISLDYLFHYLRCYLITQQIKFEQTIGAQPNLSLTQVSNFKIIVPDEDVQKLTVNYLNKNFSQIDNCKNHLKQLYQLRKSCIHSFLSQTIRFKEENLNVQ
jgi:type I restriction enzyme, S subunit